MAHLRAAMILRGDGSLTGVAQRLHRATLGERPFVALRPGEDGIVALRNYGVSEGAKRLGIHHSALTRWAQRRHLPT